jgi:hypothetical protein
VATMDRLWMPFLVHHFSEVMPPAPLLLVSPTRRFSALALTPCSVCNDNLLPSKPRVDPEWIRYSAPGSCGGCGLLCCAICHCRCSCLHPECNKGMIRFMRPVENCGRCHGWAHENCECIRHCSWCHAKMVFAMLANPKALLTASLAITSIAVGANGSGTFSVTCAPDASRISPQTNTDKYSTIYGAHVNLGAVGEYFSSNCII